MTATHQAHPLEWLKPGRQHCQMLLGCKMVQLYHKVKLVRQTPGSHIWVLVKTQSLLFKSDMPQRVNLIYLTWALAILN